MSIKDMLGIKSKSEQMLEEPRNYLKYKLVVTDQDGEDVREMELLLPTETFSKEKEETLKALLTLFNKVKAEHPAGVLEYLIHKGEQV